MVRVGEGVCVCVCVHMQCVCVVCVHPILCHAPFNQCERIETDGLNNGQFPPSCHFLACDVQNRSGQTNSTWPTQDRGGGKVVGAVG